MSPASIFCTYIYGSFLVVKAALEIALALAKTTLNMLNALFDAFISYARTILDVALELIIDTIKVLQKHLLDLIPIFNLKGTAFCSNLYRCNIFIQELSDTSSLTFVTLRNLGVLNREQEGFIADLVSDFATFRETVCNFGFSFSFGISAIKKVLKQFKATCKGFIDFIERKKESIRRLIQAFLNKCQDCGIWDLMNKLKAFFNCILEQTDMCTAIRTASNFFDDCCAKLHIEEAGTGGFVLEAALRNKMMNAFDARLNTINNITDTIDRFMMSLQNSSDVVAANKAWSLSSNIFPGGMTGGDIIHGRWKKNKAYQYVSTNWNTFMELFFGKHPSLAENGISTDYVLCGTKINDETGVIEINTSQVSETIDMNNTTTAQYYGSAVSVVQYDTPLEYQMSEEGPQEGYEAFIYQGKMISAMRAALQASVEGDVNLKNRLYEKMNGMTGLLKESELAVEY